MASVVVPAVEQKRRAAKSVLRRKNEMTMRRTVLRWHVCGTHQNASVDGLPQQGPSAARKLGTLCPWVTRGGYRDTDTNRACPHLRASMMTTLRKAKADTYPNVHGIYGTG